MGWLIFVGVRIGSAIIDRLDIESLDDLERLGFSLGVGWGVMATALAVLGLLGLWRLPVVYGALVVLTVWGVIDMRREQPNKGRAATLRLESLDRVLGGLILTFGALNLFCAFVPETFTTPWSITWRCPSFTGYGMGSSRPRTIFIPASLCSRRCFTDWPCRWAATGWPT
ncbi:MAG: hypothetical protein M0D55_08065 [Elusimicrobiota bacterium]|nr:MAG: hypothetical protein M0D55_08065 [Elusimicrobiota bacterium]